MKNITVTAAAHPRAKDVTVLSPKGFIDTNTAPEFDRAFQSVLATQKYNIIVDLKDVTYISSVGWGIFIGELKRIRSQNGNLVLTGMTPEVAEAYKLLEFDSIIKAFPDTDQAVAKGFSKAVTAKKGAGKGSVEAAPQPVPVASVSSSPSASAPSVSSVPAPQRSPEPRRMGFFEWLVKPWKWF